MRWARSTAQPVALIVPQLALERRRLLRRLDACKRPELVADALELVVEIGVGLRGQQGVENHRLRRQKSQRVPLGFGHFGDWPILAEPIGGEHAARAVAQVHVVLSALQCREQIGQRGFDALEVAIDIQIEPIDPRRDADVDLNCVRS